MPSASWCLVPARCCCCCASCCRCWPYCIASSWCTATSAPPTCCAATATGCRCCSISAWWQARPPPPRATPLPSGFGSPSQSPPNQSPGWICMPSGWWPWFCLAARSPPGYWIRSPWPGAGRRPSLLNRPCRPKSAACWSASPASALLPPPRPWPPSRPYPCQRAPVRCPAPTAPSPWCPHHLQHLHLKHLQLLLNPLRSRPSRPHPPCVAAWRSARRSLKAASGRW